MNKKLIIILSSASALFCSCDPFPVVSSSSKEIAIDIRINRVSAGFADITYTPSDQTFYLSGIQKAIPGVIPKNIEDHFMALALDSAYVEYAIWRHEHLVNLDNAIADFPSHSLDYGEINTIENFLEPDTDYWAFAFAVGKDSNKPRGHLYAKLFHTEKESIFKNIRFEYRVNGDWDYVYPYDKETNQIVTDVPWIGMTLDSLVIHEIGGGSTPGELFKKLMELKDKKYTRVLKGIYVHHNNGTGDGSSFTKFEEGHTYYTGMATLDGPLNECFCVYKFLYKGESTQLYFTEKDSNLGW